MRQVTRRSADLLVPGGEVQVMELAGRARESVEPAGFGFCWTRASFVRVAAGRTGVYARPRLYGEELGDEVWYPYDHVRV